MALWDNVLAGFDAEDETLNFGTRAVAESKSVIYESKTLATIQATDKESLNTSPQVLSMFHPKAGLAVCADRSFTLFNSEGSIVLMNGSFNSIIDALDISSDGDLIFFGLSSGDLICLHLPTNGTSLFSLNLNIHSAKFQKNFYSRISSNILQNNLEILAVSVFGDIYRIYGLELEEGHGDNEVNQLSQKFKQNIKFNIIQPSNSIPDNDLEYYASESEFLLTGSCIKLLSNSFTHCCNVLSFTEKITLKKVYSIPSRFIICLTIDGDLLFLCPYTMQQMFIWQEDKVKDFTVIESDFQGSKCSKLLFLTSVEASELVLLTLNGFSVDFRLTVSKDSFLVDNQSTCEDFLFLEGFGEDQIDTLRVKSLNESQTDYRLDRFLQKGCFDKAAKFADRFNLSSEIVHKAKVKWLMGELQPWSRKEDRSITELIDILKLIKDERFVAECCINTIPPDIDSASQLLDYGISRLNHVQNKSDHLENYIKQIGNLSVRLGTFMQIEHESRTPEKWLSFSVINLVNVCNMYLSKGKIKEAVIICERHRPQMKIELTEEQGLHLLEVIPPKVDIDSIVSWLKCFIPLFLSAQENVMEKCLDWVERRTMQLEYLESDAWPEIGLTFCTRVLEVFKSIMKESVFVHRIFNLYQGNQQISSPIKHLEMIIMILGQLCTLKKNHSLLVPFEMLTSDPYVKESRMEVIWLLFENVPLDGIRHLINNFVDPYCLQHFINVDTVIMQYLKKVCTRSNWWQTESFDWECRVIAFIECIKNIDEKMVSILTLLKEAPVPWRNEVDSLADSAIKLNHRMSSVIYAERKLVEKKLVLKKYGLPLNDDLSNTNSLIRYIFKQGHEDMLEDAKKLSKSENSLEPFVYYILHCIELGDVEKIFSILNSKLPVEKLIERVLYLLSSPNRFRRKELNGNDVVPAIMSRLSMLKSELAVQYGHLKAIETLKSDFGVEVGLKDICCSKVRQEVLTVCVKKILFDALGENESEETSDEAIDRMAHTACKAARLLEFPTEEGIVELTLQCLKPEFFKLSTKFFRLLLLSESMGKCDSNRLFQLICKMLLCSTQNCQHYDSQLANGIHKISTHLLAYCESSRELRKFLDLNKVTSLLIDAPIKPKWTKFYVDPMGYSFRRLSSDMISVFFECILGNPVKDLSEYHEQKSEVVQFQSVFSFIKELPHELASLRTVFTLHWLFCSNFTLDFKELKLMHDCTALIVFKLIQKILSSRLFDLQLTLSLLHFFRPDQAVQYLKNISKSNAAPTDRSLRNLSLVGKQYCLLHNFELVYHFDFIQKMCKWALEVQKYGLSPREPFKETDVEKRGLLLKLIDIPDIDMSVLWEYCKDMFIEQQECIFLYLEHTILSWNPVFKVVPNSMTGEPSIVLETSYQELLMQCTRIVTQIKNKEELVALVNKVWKQTNTYNYECFFVMIELLETYSGNVLPLAKLLLSFLNKYVRVCGPKEQEIESWFSKFPDSENMPEISRYRLPFAPLPAGALKWEFIKPEVNLKTYNLWLQAPIWFNVSLDKDMICTITIQNLKNEEAPRKSWDLHRRNEHLKKEIMECVEHIKSLEMLTTALYFVVNHVLPPGVDQVDVVQKCYLYAQAWNTTEKSTKSYEGLMKVKKKYFSISTLYILHKNGLVRPEYLNLVHSPTELIAALYQDPSIVNQPADSFTIQPDINKAAESIAALHDVNIFTIRSELLSEWLQPDNCLNWFNETIVSSDTSQESSSELENIMRACYTLGRDVNKLGNYLVGLAFRQNDDDMSRSISFKLRVLKCLVARTTPEELEMITERDNGTIRNYMQSLEFVSSLERVGFSYTVSGFEQFSKPELVKMLLSREESSTVHLASSICQAFDIKTPAIWNRILDVMTSLCMFQELEVILPEISDIAVLDHNILVRTWNQFLTSFVNRVCAGENEEEIWLKVEKSLEYFRICPVLKALDLPAICNCLQRITCKKLLHEISLITNSAVCTQ